MQGTIRFCFLVMLAATFTGLAVSLNNGLARTPPMGWLAWERFRCDLDCKDDPDNCISEKLFLDMGKRLSEDGWTKLGYDRVNIDDCWPTKQRDAEGRLVADPERFPHGIKWLAEELAKMGVKLGIYEDYGNYTCGGYPGTLGHITTDAQTFASWEVDMLKMDGCYAKVSKMNAAYPEIGIALNKTGRPILYSCSWPDYERVTGTPINYTLVAQYCNIWRNFNDIQDSWQSVYTIIDYYGDPKNYEAFGKIAGPGNWNDPDMLIVGDFSLSFEQSKAQFAFWCLMASPLFMSNDLRAISDEAKTILQNTEILAVNQDPLGVQGYRVHQYNNHEVWCKPLHDKSVAVILWNRSTGGMHSKITVQFKQVGLPASGNVTVRDLYEHQDMGSFSGSYSTYVNPAGGVVMLKLTPVALADRRAAEAYVL
eukprot:scpid25793/ scgid2744/ Alpha-N-acetylgalactosaminidase; Alpha-galactosidase B